MTNLLLRPEVQAWLLFIAVVCVLVFAAASVIGVGLLLQVARGFDQKQSLTEKLQPLLDSGDVEAVVHQSRERLMTFPDDATAHYFLGIALQRRGDLRQALVHLRRIPELHAGWDVAPMIKAIEERLANSQDAPDLRVVKLPQSEALPSDA